MDGVNEVLKDMDVPPVIGAGGTHWDHVDHDGTVYFPFVRIYGTWKLFFFISKNARQSISV